MKKDSTLLRSLLFIVLLMSGCGGDYRDPAVTAADRDIIDVAVNNHPALKSIPGREVGSLYDDGDSWRIEYRRHRRKTPVLWFRVDKATKKATLIE
jgi:hypothetical protein